MSHLLALPHEEKKDTRVSQSEPVITHTSFLVSLQEERSGHSLKNASDQSWLAPPQEEMVSTADLRGEQLRLDRAVDRFGEQINKRNIERDATKSIDEVAHDNQQRDSVLSRAAGVTGEDVGIAEKTHLV